jgi:hypothetical protein
MSIIRITQIFISPKNLTKITKKKKFRLEFHAVTIHIIMTALVRHFFDNLSQPIKSSIVCCYSIFYIFTSELILFDFYVLVIVL